MTKVSKAVNKVTKNIVKASGVATKVGGETLSRAARKIGVSEDKCDGIMEKSDVIGKDMYYGNQAAGYRAEKVTDKVIDKVRDKYHSVIDDKDSK